MRQIEHRSQFQGNVMLIVGSYILICVPMFVIIVGTEGQFPRPCSPEHGIPDAQLLIVRSGEVGVPVVFYTGVYEEILRLIGIAQRSLMHNVGADIACIEYAINSWCCLVSQEFNDLGYEETSGKQCLYEMASCLIAHTGQIGVVVARVLSQAIVG